MRLRLRSCCQHALRVACSADICVQEHPTTIGRNLEWHKTLISLKWLVGRQSSQDVVRERFGDINYAKSAEKSALGLAFVRWRVT